MMGSKPDRGISKGAVQYRLLVYPPKALMTTLASPILLAAFPQPSATLASPKPPSTVKTLFPAPEAKVTFGCLALNAANLRSKAMTRGEEYWANIRDASKPGTVDVRRESRARRSLGEENGDIFESVMIVLCVKLRVADADRFNRLNDNQCKRRLQRAAKS